MPPPLLSPSCPLPELLFFRSLYRSVAYYVSFWPVFLKGEWKIFIASCVLLAFPLAVCFGLDPGATTVPASLIWKPPLTLVQPPFHKSHHLLNTTAAVSGLRVGRFVLACHGQTDCCDQSVLVKGSMFYNWMVVSGCLVSIIVQGVSNMTFNTSYQTRYGVFHELTYLALVLEPIYNTLSVKHEGNTNPMIFRVKCLMNCRIDLRLQSPA